MGVDYMKYYTILYETWAPADFGIHGEPETNPHPDTVLYQ